MTRSHRLGLTWLVALVLSSALPLGHARAASGSRLRLGAEAGLGLLDRDLHAQVSGLLAYEASGLRLALHAPLRLRLYDASPAERGATPGLRREDWDEASDWTRILRWLELEPAGRQGKVRLGEIAGTSLGRGGVVGRYYNTVDPDHYHTGLAAFYDFGLGRAEAIVGDVLDAEVVSLRLSVEPWRLPAGAVELGVTAATDRRAPLWPGTAAALPGRDSTGRLVMPHGVVTATGFDLGWQPRAGTGLGLAAWLEASAVHLFGAEDATLADNGVGGVLGLAVQPAGAPGELRLRGELRLLEGLWLPAWFGPLYEIERYQIPGEAGVRSKVVRAARDGSRAWRAGYLAGADARLPGGLRAQVAFDWNDVEHGSLQLWLVLPEIERLQVRLAYVGRGLRAAEDAVDLDRALALVSARFQLPGRFYAAFGVGSRFRTVPLPGGRGRYEGLFEANLALGVDAAL